MAEAEEWVQQDGEWDCCNCGVVFPDGKPVGYDFDRNAVKDLPPNLHSVPFWQERKYCDCCWEAWEEGYAEAVRIRHNADLQQEMRAPAAAPAAAPAEAPAAAPALPFVEAVPIKVKPVKKAKPSDLEKTFEEAFPFACTKEGCVPTKQSYHLKRNNCCVKTFAVDIVPTQMRYQFKWQLDQHLRAPGKVTGHEPDVDVFYECLECKKVTATWKAHRMAGSTSQKHSTWHVEWHGDPRIEGNGAVKHETRPVLKRNKKK
jgi:hypothetical protein